MKNPLKTAMNYMLCLVISGISCSPSLASGQTINTKKDTEMSEVFDKSERKMSDEEVEQRGKAFQEAIRQHWKDLEGYNPHVTITGIVEKYIPVGMSFADAEKILCSAGFLYELSSNKDGTKYVFGSLDISPKQFLMVVQKTEVFIYIEPAIQNDFNSVIGKVGGVIHYAAL